MANTGSGFALGTSPGRLNITLIMHVHGFV